MGGNPEDYTGKSLLDVYGEKEGRKYLKRFEKCKKSKHPVEYHDRVIIDGKTYHFHSIYHKSQDRDGAIKGYYIVSRDISKRVRMEEDHQQYRDALRSSEEKYRRIIEQSNQMFYTHDTNNILTYVSPASYDILGYTPEEMKKDWTTLLTTHPVNKIGIGLTDKALKTGKKQPAYFLELIRKDGKKRWIEINEYPLKDQNGKIIGISGSVTDVTYRRNADEIIRESEEKFRSIFEFSPFPMFIMDKNERVSESNAKLEELLGMPKDQLVNKNIHHFFSDDYMKVVNENISKCMSEGFAGEQVQMLRKEGLPADVQITLSGIKDRDGKILSILFIVQDLSYQKDTEMELAKYRHGLESLVKERTGELEGSRKAALSLLQDVNEQRLAAEKAHAKLVSYQEDLEKAKQKAEEASKAKSDFLTSMSHEIRTPINAITGYTYLARQSISNSKAENYLDKIENSTKLLLSVINDVLDFAKIEARKLELHNKEFIIEDVVNNVLDITSILAQEKGLEIVNEIYLERLKLLGDPFRLEQILINLMSNAIKFTPSGEVVIQSKILEEKDEIIKIRFSVSDTGIGIPKEEQKRLFTPFQQVDTSTTRIFGGTGLGLAISKSLVEAMDGEIWFTSKPGKGSTFYFTVTMPVIEHQPGRSSLMPPKLKGLPVAVCDDNKSSLNAISDYLQSLGLRIDKYTSGSELLRVCQKSHEIPYRLIFLDQDMPENDGLSIFEKLKLDVRITVPPVILMLPATYLEDRMDMVKKSAVDHIVIKPINCSSLFNAVIDVLSKGDLERLEAGILQRKYDSDKSEGRLKGASVLLVEDNVINQEVIKSVLATEGISVHIEGNGKKALEYLKSLMDPSEVNLILMDLHMPVMDGYECSRKIKRIKPFSKVPIIAMTADVIAGVKEKCKQAGMSDYISKPIDPDEVFNRLQKWLHFEEKIPASSKPHKSTDGEKIIDFDDGLKRLGNNEKLYFSLLKKFMDENEHLVEEVENMIPAGEHDRAKKKIHSVKGAAANLGLKQLASVAFDLEKALKNNDNDATVKILADFQQNMNAAFREIQLLLEKSLHV